MYSMNLSAVARLRTSMYTHELLIEKYFFGTKPLLANRLSNLLIDSDIYLVSYWLKTILELCKNMSVNYGQNIPNQSPTMVGDPIAHLPVDQDPPNHNEVEIVNALFKKNRGVLETIVEDSKDALFAGILVILFSLPQIDLLINKLVPVTTKSPYITVLVKGLIAVAVFWLVKYFYLSRKK
jgi:hypothetical protein